MRDQILFLPCDPSASFASNFSANSLKNDSDVDLPSSWVCILGTESKEAKLLFLSRLFGTSENFDRPLLVDSKTAGCFSKLCRFPVE